MMYPFMPGNYLIYLLFSLPALLLGLWAQLKVKGAFNKYSQVPIRSRFSGAEVARRLLDMNYLNDVRIEQVSGMLSDHYDPGSRVLRLSPEVYSGSTVAAAGVAAHEAGHAIQHKEGYFPLQLRTLMVPSVQIGSWLGPIIFMVGLFMAGSFGTNLAWAGLILFAVTALFALVTLPVEFDASKRAKAWLGSTGLIMQDEMKGVNSVLDAAAMTYLAAAIQAVSTILYYAFLLTGRSRDD
jgi:Zn-dependent membrane protease YugP